MTAVSSMRLLVVSGAPPESSFLWAPYSKMAPQPPGPGLPEQAPFPFYQFQPPRRGAQKIVKILIG